MNKKELKALELALQIRDMSNRTWNYGKVMTLDDYRERELLLRYRLRALEESLFHTTGELEYLHQQIATMIADQRADATREASDA